MVKVWKFSTLLNSFLVSWYVYSIICKQMWKLSEKPINLPQESHRAAKWLRIWLTSGPKVTLTLGPTWLSFYGGPSLVMRSEIAEELELRLSTAYTAVFENHSRAVRNHFLEVSSLWYYNFIQHQPRMQTWSHSVCSFSISTAFSVQHTRELLTANRPC